jgi:hypothetical protein
LIEETGSKEGRRIRLNQRAKTILLAPPDREAEKQEAIRKAALSPKSYQALWVKHSGKLPSDHGLRYELQTEGGLNDLVIREFIKDFKATVQFAKLTESATLSEDSGADESGEEGREDDQRDPPDEPSRRQKADRMPDTQRGRAMDFPIPLLGGGVATLRLPVPLSRAEYAHFKTFLASMLSGMEPAVTREPQPEVSAGGATDDPNGR